MWSPIVPFLTCRISKSKDGDFSPEITVSDVSVWLDLQSFGAGGPNRINQVSVDPFTAFHDPKFHAQIRSSANEKSSGDVEMTGF